MSIPDSYNPSTFSTSNCSSSCVSPAASPCGVQFHTFDYLADLPDPTIANDESFVEISFDKGARKDFYRNINAHTKWKIGDMVVVEATPSYDIGMICAHGFLAQAQMRKKKYKESERTRCVLRKASEEELEKFRTLKTQEQAWLTKSRVIARDLNLVMKISKVEIQGDGQKAIFYYTADERVDFRELIKNYAATFRVKIEMRHISPREEASKTGALGSCGRVLCCSTWMTHYESVNITTARYQGLSINKAKLSGQCGRLKCCLNFELDWYAEMSRKFPEHAETIHTELGTGKLIKKDLFAQTLIYNFDGTTHTIAIADVHAIIAQNKQGNTPAMPECMAENTDGDKSKESLGFNNVEEIALKNLSVRKPKNAYKKRSAKPQHNNHVNRYPKSPPPSENKH